MTAVADVTIARNPRHGSSERLEPLLAFLSIVALMCSSLELELLERLDGLRRYMTLPEIFSDASVALVILFVITVAGFMGLFSLTQIANSIPSMRRHTNLLIWYVGLGLSFSYFAFSFCNAVRLQLFPQWHPSLNVLVAGVATIFLGMGVLSLNRHASVKAFCRSRLAPVGWLHLLLVVSMVLTFGLRGIHRLHDFQGKGRGAVSDRPDIYLISVDALAAEDMSVYSYSRNTTPNLEKFAQESFVFEYFFANANFTMPSTTAIETGKLPWTNRVFHQGGFLRGSAQGENVAALLQRQGYYTSSIASNYFASPFHHHTQDSYDSVNYFAPENTSGAWLKITNLADLNTLYTLSGPLLKALTVLRSYVDAFVWADHYASPAQLVFQRARQILEDRDIAQPHFVWAHILPPHDPYLPPQPFLGTFLPKNKLTHNYDFLGLNTYSTPAGVSVSDLRSRYDENVSYADGEVGTFLDWLKRTDRLDRSIVIVTADHGESFAHGWLTHGGPNLYSDLIRVPLIVHLPGQTQPGVITQAAEQVDLLPTILDLIGQPPPVWSDGISLKPALEGKPLPNRPIFSMTLDENSTFKPITRGTVALIDDDFEYSEKLDSHESWLYRYRTDPLEERNIVTTEAATAESLKKQLQDEMRAINSRTIPQH